MAVQTPRTSVEEFERFVAQPENADRHFEFIGGEIVEVVSNPRSSAMAYNVGFFIKLYLREHDIAGIVTGADGGYQIGSERYIPDVAYVSAERQREVSDQAYSPVPPDLAVEVLSSSNEADNMRFKVVNYLRASTTVWVVDPVRQVVEVFVPGQPPQRLGLADTIDGGAILPGFRLPVKEIFPE